MPHQSYYGPTTAPADEEISFTPKQLSDASQAAINYFLKHSVLDDMLTYVPKQMWASHYPLQPGEVVRSVGRTKISATDALNRGLDISNMVRVSPESEFYYLPPKEYSVPKVKSPKPIAYKTVGVRFLDGRNLAKVYTYRAPKKAKLHLGQEVVVPTDKEASGYITNSIGVVVELHSQQQDTQGYDYKFIVGTIRPL